ncbi:MAG: zf-HC2 domain-containing protein [Actinomycetota bacterium]|nr:zf-HC2 domain-containing protein [Actinomycetota bacterium]
MSWHLQVDILRSYANGDINPAQQFSVESHLLSCATCRSTVAGFTDRTALGRTWEVIAAEIAAPEPSTIERALLRLGISDHSARLVAATPSLRRSWLLAVSTVLALAVLVANGATNGYLFFLAVAPLLPLAGIAAAYGPGIDPTYEIGVAAPMRSFRLLLIRSVAVLISTMGLGGIAALLLPGFDWSVAAWLLPSLALVTASLALSTIVHPLRAAASVAGGWAVAVGAATWAVAGDVAARTVFGLVMQMAVLVVTLGGGLILATRRDEFERGEHR